MWHFCVCIFLYFVRSQQTESSSTSAPCCTSHHRPATLRVVHKQGENKGRQFYACSLPRENKCNFFEVNTALVSKNNLCGISSHCISIKPTSLELKFSVMICYFSLSQWADLHFPICHHGKCCLMRTVLKLGPNNGRNFFTCSFQKGKQCDFFQWAHSGAGLSILPGC